MKKSFPERRNPALSRKPITSAQDIVPEALPGFEKAREGEAPPWFWGSAYALRAYVYVFRTEGGKFIDLLFMAVHNLLPPVPLILVPELPSETFIGPDVEGLMSWLEKEG
ncbi:MAG: hypothetical protein JSV84_02550, partial [Gemmatimonadota bacterium]